jgi:hypothetical protein
MSKEHHDKYARNKKKYITNDSYADLIGNNEKQKDFEKKIQGQQLTCSRLK